MMRNNGKLLVFERLDGGTKLDDPINIEEAIRIGAPTRDVNAHINYATTNGIDA